MVACWMWMNEQGGSTFLQPAIYGITRREAMTLGCVKPVFVITTSEPQATGII